MRNDRFRIVPATPEIIASYYGKHLPLTVRAVAAMDGEEIIGIGGVYLQDSSAVLFTDMTDRLRSNKRLLVSGIRAINEIISHVIALNIPLYAKEADGIDGTDVLMRHMKFDPMDEKTKVWAWPGSVH